VVYILKLLTKILLDHVLDTVYIDSFEYSCKINYTVKTLFLLHNNLFQDLLLVLTLLEEIRRVILHYDIIVVALEPFKFILVQFILIWIGEV